MLNTVPESNQCSVDVAFVRNQARAVILKMTLPHFSLGEGSLPWSVQTRCSWSSMFGNTSLVPWREFSELPRQSGDSSVAILNFPLRVPVLSRSDQVGGSLEWQRTKLTPAHYLTIRNYLACLQNLPLNSPRFHVHFLMTSPALWCCTVVRFCAND